MAVTFFSFEQYPLSKPAQPLFRPVLQDLMIPPQPLSVFILPNSWLLFDAASEYQLLTQPRPDCPEYEVDPITATGLVGL